MTLHLVPLDFSAGSGAALDYAIHNVFGPANEDDVLVLLHVAGRPPSAGKTAEPQGEAEEHALERAREVFRGHTADLDRRGIKHKEVVVFGDPRDKIIEVAAECGVANIIIGSRGLGAVKRMVLGSVAEYVVKHAACHVIVARSSTAGDIRK